MKRLINQQDAGVGILHTRIVSQVNIYALGTPYPEKAANIGSQTLQILQTLSFRLFQERSSLRIMSYQTLPRCPDAPQIPPETDSTEELLIKDSEGPPPEPFGSGDRFYSDLL